MRRLIPMTVAALCAFATPALAQDDDQPDLDRLIEKTQELMQRMDGLVEPLLEKAEETLHEAMGEAQEWMQGLDWNDMFQDLNAQEMLEKIQRMFEEMQRGDNGEDGDGEEDGEEDGEFI